MKKDKSKINNEIISFLKERKARKIAVFGSYVRDEEMADSDIDIIVEFNDRKSLLDFVGIERELSEKIGIKVDLLTEQSISPYLIDRVREEMKVIYQ
ncbi:MAG: nucleotidyltransferase family protein [Bacteroidota bacterium]|nr:nucleotidyltransferase family protein [Bacteroidota bacterium]